MKTARAVCPSCGRSQTYTYLNRVDQIRTAAVALETMPHEPDCRRYTRKGKARGDARQLQASMF